MTKSDDRDPRDARPPRDLPSSATSLESELKKLEDTVREAQRLEINSDKTLQKARKHLEACSEHQLALAGYLQDLVHAMQAAQGRVQASMDDTLEISQRVAARANERGELVERFATLGRRTMEINEPVGAVVEKHTQGAPPGELLAAVSAVLDVADGLVAEAETLANDAKAGGWTDIGKEADSLRQQILAARNKVMILRRGLSEKAPS